MAEKNDESQGKEEEFVDFGAEIPDELKGLRACLRCSLLKTFRQVSVGPNPVSPTLSVPLRPAPASR